MKPPKCPNCGRETGERGHLCSPGSGTEKAYECEHCGKTDADPRHVCFPKLARMKFTCAGCGRVAVEDSALCSPKPIEGGDRE